MRPLGQRPWIKICGVTRPEDAALAAELGAAFVGINFWPHSKRFVEIDAAEAIVAAAREVGSTAPATVGVFVNEEPARVEEIVESVGLDFVQLHGDEPDDVVVRFGSRALRGVRVEGRLSRLLADCVALDGERADEAHRAFDAALARAGLSLQWKAFAVVLDSPKAAAGYGGSGEPWGWGQARALCARSPTPILIAGGVTPETAGEALAASGAAGLDLASGVELAPGIKDREKMVRLFEEVRRVAR